MTSALILMRATQGRTHLVKASEHKLSRYSLCHARVYPTWRIVKGYRVIGFARSACSCTDCKRLSHLAVGDKAA